MLVLSHFVLSDEFVAIVNVVFENVHIVLKLPWLGFDQGFGRRWTPHELIKVIEQTSNGP